MRIALAQISPKISRDNVDKHVDFIHKAIGQKADVIVFPELSLSGYMMMDMLYEEAYEVDQLEALTALSRDIDIVVGLPLREEHHVFNSALYLSDGEVRHIHHKNHLPNYGMFEEARFFFKGDLLESFETRNGRAVMVVCEDLWNAGTIEKIAQMKPDIVYVIAASPARDFKETTLLIDDKWSAILKTTALFSAAHVCFVNRVGYEDGIGFWGGSRVVKPDTACSEQAKLFDEELLVVTIDKELSKIEKYMKRY
jgi:predicted amidohydrolase